MIGRILGVWLAVILLAGLFLGGQAMAESKMHIKFSTWHPPMSREVKTVWIPMLEELKKRSNGRITYTLYAGSALGKGPEHFDIVKNGLSDMGYFTATWTPGRFPMTDVLSLATWVGYLVFGYFTLRYSLDRNALVINWASSKQIIPLDQIISARKGAELTNRISKNPRFRWWGYMVGLGRIAGIGSTLFYATSPLKSQVIVSTSSLNYAISPPDIEAFLGLVGCLTALTFDGITVEALEAMLNEADDIVASLDGIRPKLLIRQAGDGLLQGGERLVQHRRNQGLEFQAFGFRGLMLADHTHGLLLS